MREILFRGKCIDETCLKGQWLEGQILHDGVTGKYYIHRDKCLNESDNIGEEGLLRFVAYEVDPETVCQCTGLTDKNGRSIFELEMITIDSEKGYFVVEWYPETAKFVISNDDVTFDFDDFWNGKIEVIGNIFDNPALLTQN